MNFLTKKLTIFLLALWLILTGLIPLLNLNIPSGETILAVLAVIVGVLTLLDVREKPSKNLGRVVLAIWLIVVGLIPLLSITFPSSELVLAVLAAVAGVLLLIGR